MASMAQTMNNYEFYLLHLSFDGLSQYSSTKAWHVVQTGEF